ncbi:hypothetical protein C4J95_3739 [Pseudomonas orientalis]|nr:hypothetical protein C4J95_3739 [Pseudomonas orientalis]
MAFQGAATVMGLLRSPAGASSLATIKNADDLSIIGVFI